MRGCGRHPGSRPRWNEFLHPRDPSAKQLASALRMPVRRISDMVNEEVAEDRLGDAVMT